MNAPALNYQAELAHESSGLYLSVLSAKANAEAEAEVPKSSATGTNGTGNQYFCYPTGGYQMRGFFILLLAAVKSCGMSKTIDDMSLVHHMAAGTVQRHWRGRGYRLRVLKKWLGHAADGLDAQEEQRLHELSLLVEELSPLNPSALSSTDVSEGASAATFAVHSLTHVTLPPGRVTEEGALELGSAFCRERLLAPQSVVQLLERQIELHEGLSNVCEYAVQPGTELRIVGDLHGQFGDLMHIFRKQARWRSRH